MKTTRIVTHNGDFHCDEICAVAILMLALGEDIKIEVLRTRDAKEIEAADCVVDVGGIYDEVLKRFDHHQPGGAGKRDNGIPFASCGLVWKTFGEKICGSVEVAAAVDAKMIAPIDAVDNGFNLSQPIDGMRTYNIHDAVYAFRPTWKEDFALMDQAFNELVYLAKRVIKREVLVAQHKLEAIEFVKQAYESAADKRLIVLEKKYPFVETILKYAEPLFVVYPEPNNKDWIVKAVVESIGTFKNRKDMPKAWGGKKNEELASATGVSDAVFCHNQLFSAVARSKEGAMSLARLAIES